MFQDILGLVDFLEFQDTQGLKEHLAIAELADGLDYLDIVEVVFLDIVELKVFLDIAGKMDKHLLLVTQEQADILDIVEITLEAQAILGIVEYLDIVVIKERVDIAESLAGQDYLGIVDYRAIVEKMGQAVIQE